MMVETRNSNNSMNSNKNGGKKNSNGDKPKLGGNKNENTKNRFDGNSNNNGNKNSKNKNSKRNSNNGVNLKNSGTKTSKQETLQEAPKTTVHGGNSDTNCRNNKSKMVDSATQTSTPLRLHLDGMFQNTAGGYQRSLLNSVEEEGSEEDEEDEEDEVKSEIGAPVSPLSSCRSSARASFSTKEYSYGYNFKVEWPENSKKGQVLLHPESVPRCYEDLEKIHERKLLRLTEQLNSLVTATEDSQQ